MAYLASVLVKKDHTIKDSVISTVSLLKRGRDQPSGRMDKWKLNLSWSLGLFVTLILILSLPSTALPSKKYSGNFNTESIRILWQMCSVNHKMQGYPQNVYYPICDCFIDCIRSRYDNSTEIDNMTKTEADELATVLRLSCNTYRSN